ncbi:MAG: hypothetical protein JWP87_1536 [Labilithrix sp.]|nr:hypothetical protein [Labilithrix sp.]
MVLPRSLAVLLAAMSTLVAANARADDATAGDPAPPSSDARRDSPADSIDSPSIVGAVPLLTQAEAGLDVTASLRQRALPPVVGSELDARVTFARREGALSLSGDAMLRRAIGTRDDVDAQASMTHSRSAR